MAKKGLSKPFFGKYSESSGTVSYSEFKTLGHAIEYSVDLDTAEDNVLYGDNMIIERDSSALFNGGTLTLNTSELTGALSKWMLGLGEATQTVGTGQDAVTVTEYVYDDDINPPILGFGIIEMHQIDDVTKYRTVMLCKLVPNIPADACSTKGETVDWQTQEITYKIERDDSAKHRWKIDAWHDTEADAIAYLQTKLGYSAG